MTQRHRQASLALLTIALAGVALAMPGSPQLQATDPGADTLPGSLELVAVIRDFRAKDDRGGHPDFESFANPHITTGLVEDELDADNKPVFRAKRGQQIRNPYRDASGRPMNPALFDAQRGDVAGELTMVESDQLTSPEYFAQWYRDTPGVNASKAINMTFHRVEGTNRYVFDSAQDQPYADRGGFFPIDDDLLGNFAATGKNFSFTTEIATQFVFDRAQNHVFTFTGDDDVWVYIDGRLVLDLGGLHPKREQSLELNRLDWLRDGGVHSLRVFHAERHTTQSNFRIETTLRLKKVEPPPVSGLFD